MDNNYLLLLPIIIPILSGLSIRSSNLDKIYRQTGITVIVNFVILISIYLMARTPLDFLNLTENLTIRLGVDDISLFFTALAGFIWIFVTFYSFEYMRIEEDVKSFYRFFLISYGLVIGIGFSGNLFTFYLFYEFMTLMTLPLVTHARNEESIRAGINYLIYSIGGAALVLVAIIYSYYYGVVTNFVPGGMLEPSVFRTQTALIVYFLGFLGFGSKAGMFPLHAWLPLAHPVAPAPASGILSGIITKAGVLGIIRLTYFVFGADFIRGTWAQYLLMGLALFTIFMGSMLAFGTDLMKERLAYSSVSQVSYILFGLILLNTQGLMGGLLHMTFHALIKNILFLGAGAMICQKNIHLTTRLQGIGKEMPIVMWTFTIASLALIGIPPLGGFLSKWYLGMGGLNFENFNLGLFGVVVIIISALLTGGYLIPIFVDAFFPGDEYEYNRLIICEPSKLMTRSLMVLTIAAVVIGLFPGPLVNFFQGIASTLLGG